MTYLCILFASPLYFALRGKWGGFFLNSLLYGTAWLFLVSLIGAMIAPVFWALGVGHASWYLRGELMAQHADLIATKMAEKMAQLPVKATGTAGTPAVSATEFGASGSE